MMFFYFLFIEIKLLEHPLQLVEDEQPSQPQLPDLDFLKFLYNIYPAKANIEAVINISIIIKTPSLYF